jgi:hypothetical protein
MKIAPFFVARLVARAYGRKKRDGKKIHKDRTRMFCMATQKRFTFAYCVLFFIWLRVIFSF